MLKDNASIPAAVEPVGLEKTHKVWQATGPTGLRLKAVKPAAHARTSNTLETRAQLTQREWLTVMEWHEKQLKANPQFQFKFTAEHFQDLGWKVTHSNFGRKWKVREDLRTTVAATPNGAHTKRARIVTHLQVNRALIEWQ